MQIYKTTNLINGKIYIGKESRNKKKYYGSGVLLNRAIKKYGLDNFKKDILEIGIITNEELNKREIYWINFFNSTNKKIGYNILFGGTGGDTFTNSPNKENTRLNLKKAVRFKNETKEQKNNRISKLKGQKRTQETKDKISKGNLNKKRTKEMTDKISESVKKHFETKKGIKQKEKLGKRLKGKRKTAESNKKRSLTMKGTRPKKLDVHPSAQYWYFYNHNNVLIIRVLGSFLKTLKDLKTNWRKILKFESKDECLNCILPNNYDFKIFHEKYYKK